MPSISLSLPLPPTVNHVWKHTRTGQVYKVQVAKDYQNVVWAKVMMACPDGLPVVKPPIKAEAVFYFGNQRRQDIDNRAKVLLDCFASALHFDDSGITEIRLTKEYEPGAGRCEVTLTWGGTCE